MSALVVYWDDSYLHHDLAAGTFSLPATDLLAVNEPHPDRPERVRNIRHLLNETITDEELAVEPASWADLNTVHESDYLHQIKKASEKGPTRLTSTTVASQGTFRAARHAAGAAIQTARAALESGIETVSYAPVRPSGHHAQSDRSDGFCFINNVAVAAAHLLSTEQVERVAILDWDVHHGNGTQDIFEDRDDVLVISIHNNHGAWDDRSHPQTGQLNERGVGAGEGYTVNIPLPLGTGDQGYEFAFDRLIEPVVSAFEPDILLVSAGQDPGVYDPLGRNVVSPGGFHRLGQWSRRLATEHADGHLGLIQEGGYQISYLAFYTLAVLLGATDRTVELEDSPIDPLDRTVQWPNTNDELARNHIRDAVRVYDSYWPLGNQYKG